MIPLMFPFVFSYDTTPPVADMSHLLVAPAGKNGRIRVENGRFVDDAGPVRLNGMNLTGPANFPSHDEAVRLADRFARFGVNCIRLHYFDADYGTFMLPKEQGIIAHDPATQRRLDPERRDRMDFLVAEFKKRGIYANVNLHVARDLDARDGVAPGTDWANKGVDQFDTRIIELEKEYARDLLSHVNPYTGLSYLDDPVVALVELNNEDALWRKYRQGHLDAIAEPYASEFRGLWNAWLVRNRGAECVVDGKSAAAGEVPIVGTKDEVPDDLRRDFYRFISYTEHTYWTGMRDYLQNELGLRAPVTGTQLGYTTPHLMAEMDFVDHHEYWCHPTVSEGENWTMENKAMVNERGGCVANLAAVRVAGKPYTVTEYNHPYPGFYGAEGMPMLHAYGAFHGWDGVFGYSYDNRQKTEPDSMVYFFSMAARTDVLAHFPACAALYLRGDVRESAAPFVANLPEKDFLDRLVATNGAKFVQGIGVATDGKVPSSTGLARKTAINVTDQVEKTPPSERGNAPQGQGGVLRAAPKDEIGVELPAPPPPRIVSDTGELVWDNSDPARGVWTVDTPNTKMFSGFPAGRVFDLGGVRLAIGETSIGWATISLVSHDATGFGEDSRPARILLAATSLSHNDGAKFTDHGENKISCRGADWGHAPVVNEGVPATITLPAPAARVTCRALDERGAPKADVPVRADEAGRAVLDIGPEYRTVWYEIDVK